MPAKQNRPGKQIAKLLQKGMRPKDIRIRLNVGGNAVKYWATKLGMPDFSRGRPLRGNGPRNPNFKADSHKAAKKMRLAGDTFSKIGRALGVSRQRAHQYFLEAD